MSTTRWLRSSEACEFLGVSRRELYRLIDHGELPAYRFGRQIRLRDEDVRRFRDERDVDG